MLRKLIGILGIVLLVVALGCTIGWQVNKKNNDVLRETECRVVDHFILEETCSRQNCDDDGNNCRTVYYSCYTGYIDVDVYQTSEAQTVIITLKRLRVGYYVRTRYYQHVVDTLSYYPIQDLIPCYYQISSDANETSTGHVQLAEYPEQSVFITSLVFYGLVVIVIVFLIVYQDYKSRTASKVET